ncbi:MAD-domain-containing protein [Lentinus tigrinus ALCF2SS1-7]|uniref:Spindle assembly checkpoint component MAD1 n=1 Tax=Lentinus tigrinus ALCF2SS1-6 TaxID=1328759 RepID=A0A5C2RN20_9APHY|nr:MAD-domain-containing protein [Lentinus tigrinus ALCF2SS1-6]RPD67965.1 MAD-domain-containing protein [Lentinus tigrinus ALCF2SS1-7]
MSNGDKFSTPLNSSSRFLSSMPRSGAIKRDSLQAELERDPQLSTAKRQQRTQAFSSTMQHAGLERQVAAAQMAKLELETKLREKEILVERLEGDRRYFSEREAEEREAKERERAEYLEEKRKADSELRTLRSSLLTLREQHADLEEEHSALSRSTAQTIATQKAQITTLTRQVSLLENELGEFKRLSEERARAFDELQMQFDELSAAQESFTLQNAQDENWSVVREELHRQANYMRQLESANAKMTAELNILHEKQTSVEVLKEQKRDLERKLRGADELREQVVKLQAELEVARKERAEWASSSAEPASPSKTPVSVTQSLSTLRLAHAHLMEEHGSNVALLRHREQEITELQAREAEAQKTSKDLRAQVRALKDQATRSEHKVTLAEREVSFLQAMLASYNAEEAAHGEGKSENETLKPMQQLEALVKDYKASVATLEKELQDIRAHPIVAEDLEAKQKLLAELEKERAAKEEAQKELKEAEEETEKHLEQIDELEQTLFELRGEIGAGRHLPPGVRVLSLRDNPAQQWEDLSKAAMDRLRSENEGLMKRLKDLEESGARGSEQDPNHEELVPRASWEAVNDDKLKLQDELKQKEKRLLRLQQVFTAKSAEFREAIASILGVKLAFYPNGQVRVTSQYDLNAAFVFQPNGQGENMKMQLVAQGDGGPEDLPQLMRYWVEQEQCIPGFLASITLECYEKNKMERERGEL